MKKDQVKTLSKLSWALVFAAAAAALAAIPAAVFSKPAGIIAVNIATLMFLVAMILPGEKQEQNNG